MELSNLRPASHYVTHLGALQGCMEYLGRDVSAPWLFGSTGYAFMINIPPAVHCKGPTSWDVLSINARTPNLGITTDHFVSAWVSEADFAERQEAAADLVRSKLDAGIPCYGVELGYPEFFTIHGHDEEGIRFRSIFVEGDEARRAWDELGVHDVGWLFVGSVEPLGATADDRKTVRDALEFAVSLDRAPPGFLGTDHTGPAAYQAWIDCMESREYLADEPHGVRHNAAFWHECRLHAEAFLRESGERLGEELRPPLAGAAEHYRDVHEALGGVKRIFTYGEDWRNPPTVEEAGVKQTIELLEAAREAEAAGLAALDEVLSRL